jgi:hypothetical protein
MHVNFASGLEDLERKKSEDFPAQGVASVKSSIQDKRGSKNVKSCGCEKPRCLAVAVISLFGTAAVLSLIL